MSRSLMDVRPAIDMGFFFAFPEFRIKKESNKSSEFKRFVYECFFFLSELKTENIYRAIDQI